MSAELLRRLALVVAALTLAWAGYTVGRVQSIGDLARLARDRDEDRYLLVRGGTVVQYERLGGGGKPTVRTGDGLDLLEVSDWDRGSVVTVDGSVFDLARLYPSSTVDQERNRVAQTLYGDGWLLERVITLEPDGSVVMDHTFVARRPVQRLELTLMHLRALLQDVRVEGGRAEARLLPLTPEQFLAGIRAEPSVRLVVDVEGAPAPTIRAAEWQLVGPRGLALSFAADRPAVDRRTPLGRVTVRWSPLPPGR